MRSNAFLGGISMQIPPLAVAVTLAQVRHGAASFRFFEAPSESKLSACNSSL